MGFRWYWLILPVAKFLLRQQTSLAQLLCRFSSKTYGFDYLPSYRGTFVIYGSSGRSDGVTEDGRGVEMEVIDGHSVMREEWIWFTG